MMKVAQGWVLTWAPPKRRPSQQQRQATSGDGERAEAIRQAGGANSSLATYQHQQQQADEQQLSEQLDGSNTGSGSSAVQSLDQSAASASIRNHVTVSSPSQSQSSYEPLLSTPLAYSIELKERNSSHWLYLATSRDQSLLLKDLKPGGEYQFRVIAHTPSGVKGTPSQEFRYQIPDMRRKPGLTQAFSATVTSGILFFIACIVIAVCGVNMCNKRRKKRAEKGE